MSKSETLPLLDPEIGLPDLALIQVRQFHRLSLQPGAQMLAHQQRGERGVQRILRPSLRRRLELLDQLQPPLAGADRA